MIELLIFLLFVVGVVWLVLVAIVKVPAYHFGILERFGRRTGRIIEEGFGVKIPFIDDVELVSLELGELDVDAKFTTSDKLQLEIKGSLQYRPDLGIVDTEGRNVFITMSEEIIRSGIEDAIASVLGGLGGVYQSDDFISNRQALADLLNAIFRLGTPPHLRHDAKNCAVCVANKSQNKPQFGEVVGAKDLIDFYNSHWQLVRGIISQERHQLTDFSPTEKRYGIDVEAFFLSRVDFSEETKKAFEKQKQAEAREKAFGVKIRMAERVKTLGASAQVALNAADVSLDPDVKKSVVSVEGEAGILGGIISNLGKGGQKP